MKAILQRVLSASVEISGVTHSNIDKGLLVLVAIKEGDGLENIQKMIRKIVNLRIFEDQDGKMNLSVNDIQGEILVVSNFTLYGNTKKGNRPSFIEAEKPDIAESTYNLFFEKLKEEYNYKVTQGKYQADMKVSLINNGPVTLTIDT